MQKTRVDSEPSQSIDFRTIFVIMMESFISCKTRQKNYRMVKQFWNPGTPRFQVLKFGIFLILVTSLISEHFQNCDPTICLLRNKENIFYENQLVWATLGNFGCLGHF